MGSLPQPIGEKRRNRNMESLWLHQSDWLLGTRLHNAALRHSVRNNGRRSLDRIAFG